MEPKIAQEFFLLSLNPKNGYYVNFGNEFGYGLLGAVIMDLYRLGKVGIKDKKLIVLDSTRTNYLLWDDIIAVIANNGAISPVRLLYKLGFKGNSTKKKLVDILHRNNDIAIVQKSFMGISYKRYFPKNRELRMSIIRRYRDILLRNQQPEKDEMLFLSLIRLGRLFRALSDQREERKYMRTKLKSILKDQANYADDYQNIKLLQQSIQRVIQASNSTTHSG